VPARRPPRAAAVAGQEPWRELIGHRPGVEDLADAKRIPVAAIDANPEQPRKTPLEGIAELAGSIREYGLLQPVVVTPPLAGRYTLLAGHRRLAAYRWLADDDRSSAWATIPAIERDTAAADRLVVALLENLSRQDLTDAEIIAGLLVLRDLRGWSQQEIARRVGVSKGWLSQYFRVATDEVVSVHVQRGELRVGKAYEIVRARDRGHKVAALGAALQGAPVAAVRRIAKGGFSNETAAGAPQDGRSRRTVTAPPDAGVRDIADVAAHLEMAVDLRSTQLMRLFQAAIETQTPSVSLEDFIRAMRADLRMADALVRSAPRPARAAPSS
jgi:ParB family transcriptional regulator, chromosome partitioning protein